MSNSTAIKVPSKAQANKLATEYLEAVIEEKGAKKRKENAAKMLQSYCKKNGMEVINEVLMPYEKQGAPVLVGAEGKQLTAKKAELVEALEGTDYLNRSISMPALFKGFPNDRLAQRILKKLGLEVKEGNTSIHFKHV